MTRKIVSEMTYNVSMETLNPTIPYHTQVFTSVITSMARIILLCADVPLRNYSLTHSGYPGLKVHKAVVVVVVVVKTLHQRGYVFVLVCLLVGVCVRERQSRITQKLWDEFLFMFILFFFFEGIGLGSVNS